MNYLSLLRLKQGQTIYTVHARSGSVHEIFLTARPRLEGQTIKVQGLDRYILSSNLPVGDPESCEFHAYLGWNSPERWWRVTQSRNQALRWANERY